MVEIFDLTRTFSLVLFTIGILSPPGVLLESNITWWSGDYPGCV